MTCKINLLFLPYHNTGGHFIDWSIQYVSGISKLDESIKLDVKNWHANHQSISAFGFEDTKNTIAQMCKDSCTDQKNIYVNPLSMQQTTLKLFNCNLNEASLQQKNSAIDYIDNNTRQLFKWCQQENFIPIIFDYCDSDIYSMFYNDRFAIDWKSNPVKSIDDNIDLFINDFFKDALMKFDGNIWDRREKIAVSYRFPTKIKNLQDYYNRSLPHLYYTTDDVWNNFPPVLLEICSILKIDVDQERFSHWMQIYQQWRNVHDPYFGRHLNRIVNAIINNEYMSLERFKLDIFKESIIQHILIKEYNLNLKNWQLEKFPRNTQDLHKLLETNFHKI